MNASNTTVIDINAIAIASSVLLISFCGILTNGLTLFICCRLLKRSNNMNQWLVLNLTCADMLFCIAFGSYFTTVTFVNQLSDDTMSNQSSIAEIPCQLWHCGFYVATVESALSLLLLNIDKCVYLYKPLHYFMIVTHRKVYGVMTLSWVIALVTALTMIFGGFTIYIPKYGMMLPGNSIIYVTYLIVCIVMPLFLSLCVSCAIAAVVNKALNTRKSLTKGDALALGKTASGARKAHGELVAMAGRAKPSSAIELVQMAKKRVTSGRKREDDSIEITDPGSRTRSSANVLAATNRRHSSHTSNLKSILFVFTTTIWTAVTVLPYRLMYAAKLGMVPNSDEQNLVQTIASFWIPILSFNAALNPLCTIFTQRQYVTELKKLFFEKLLGREPTRTYYTTLPRSSCYNGGSQNPNLITAVDQPEQCALLGEIQCLRSAKATTDTPKSRMSTLDVP